MLILSRDIKPLEFVNDKSIEYVVLSREVNSVGDMAFAGCDNLKAVTVYGSPTLGVDCFPSGMHVVYATDTGYIVAVIEDVKTLDATEPDPTPLNEPPAPNDHDGAQLHPTCEDVHYIRIEEGVTEIPEEMFSDRAGLGPVHLPESLVRIDDPRVWVYDTQTQTLIINNDEGMQGKSSPPWHERINSVRSIIVREGVTFLRDNAFDSFRNVTSVVLPSTLRSIGEKAFFLCENLSEITIPAPLDHVGAFAFFAIAQGSVIRTVSPQLFTAGIHYQHRITTLETIAG